LMRHGSQLLLLRTSSRNFEAILRTAEIRSYRPVGRTHCDRSVWLRATVRVAVHLWACEGLVCDLPSMCISPPLSIMAGERHACDAAGVRPHESHSRKQSAGQRNDQRATATHCRPPKQRCLPTGSLVQTATEFAAELKLSCRYSNTEASLRHHRFNIPLGWLNAHIGCKWSVRLRYSVKRRELASFVRTSPRAMLGLAVLRGEPLRVA
jgi:hypothetical protein